MQDNLAYQEEFREELMDGIPVMMAPAAPGHNSVAASIFNIFKNYLRGKKCVPFADNNDVYLTEKDRFSPDAFIVCDREKIKKDGIYGAPDLVVEVLSPSTAKYDRTHKMKVYAQCGVREYWIVDPSNKIIEQFFLEEGQFSLHAIYSLPPQWMLERMPEQNRAAVQTHFKCSLFDDLDIALEDIFDLDF